MADAIAEALAFAPAVALSPLPIIAVILMLSTPRSRVNGPAFVAGWVIGLAGTGSVVLLAADRAPERDGSAPVLAAVELTLAALALLIAVWQWRGRPRGGVVPEPPRWLRTVDRFGPLAATGAGVLLSAGNPKVLILAFGAGAEIAVAEISAGEQAVAFATFVAAATLGVLLPVALYFALGPRSASLLQRLREWMALRSAVIVAALMVLIAFKLALDGLGDL